MLIIRRTNNQSTDIIHQILAFSLLVFISGLFMHKSHAEELPLWELGLGLGAYHQPYYHGSDESRRLLFPVPLPIYRGNVIKSDDDGVRAEKKINEHVKLDLSLDFNLAVDSDDVSLREGMDDINTLLQIGPSIEINLLKNKRNQWLLKLPLRANFEFGDGIDTSGYTFAPNITYFHKFSLLDQAWTFGAALGPQFGTSDYNNVYYGVDEEFANDFRPAYQSDGGYAGARGLLTLKNQNKKGLFVLFARYDDISGAEFEDSPLVETSGGLSVGILYSRFIWKSQTTVNR